MTETAATGAGAILPFGASMSTQGGPLTGLPDPRPNDDFLNGVDYQNIHPQELGKVINVLQDEIKIIKSQLENLPGYAIGKPLCL